MTREMAIDELLSKVSYLREEEREVLRRAYAVAEPAHEGQSRLSGEPYVSHPVAVAGILADLGLDADTLVAALLPDPVEDNEVTRKQVSEEFGPHVAKLVDGVTKLGKIHVHTREQAQAENIRKMLVA